MLDVGVKFTDAVQTPSSSPKLSLSAACAPSPLMRVRYGFRIAVSRVAVGARNPNVREANPFDVETRYGDVSEYMEASVRREPARHRWSPLTSLASTQLDAGSRGPEHTGPESSEVEGWAVP